MDVQEPEDVKDIVKEEPLCEVDATPFAVEPLIGPPGTISVLKSEVKEELDEPSTSNSMQDFGMQHHEDNYFVNGMLQHHQYHHQQRLLMRPPPKQRVRDGINYKVVPYQHSKGLSGITVERRAMKRPGGNIGSPPSKQPIEVDEQSFREFLDANTSATSPPSTAFTPATRSKDLVPGPSASVFDHLDNVNTPVPKQKKPPVIKLREGTTSVGRVIAKTLTHDIIKEKIIPSGDFNFGRIRVRCDYCAASVDERDIVKHIKLLHGAEKKTVGLRCQDFACDFTCKTEQERVAHTDQVHRDPYLDWKNKGRFKLQKGTRCPYCKHVVNDVFALCKHLFHDHALKINMQTSDIYSCSSCEARFPRLYLVYEHWHSNPCIGPIKIERGAATIPPPAIIEDANGVVTGPRGRKGLLPIVEQ